MLEQLNADHAIADHIHFESGQGGLSKAVIANKFADAEIYLHGAHVTHFQPRSSKPVIWMSQNAQFRDDAAIRGGVPVIWPWFGPHPTDSAKPQHGFVRVMEWSVLETAVTEEVGTAITLQLSDTLDTRAIWDYPFSLELTISINRAMHIDLAATNTGNESFDAGAALHTYFNVGQIDQIHLTGLDGCHYLDKVTGYDRKQQDGAIHITSEVDRIYLDSKAEVVIHDNSLGREIHVEKIGSHSTVVWNPWSERAAAIGDFPDHGYKTMICVETTNAANDIRTIEPDKSHTLTQVISVKQP